ncbi:MAG: UPF0175 family protein [Verrucomicrobia bacterium]|nr:UPF0175 family protein [Verrucomicrobiota bacterium]
MSEILKGTRKYGLGLTLAHQTLDQLRRDEDVYGAVTGNCGIKVCFQVGGDGARKMAEEFGGFQATDLMNLPSRSAIARVGPRGDAFNLEVPFLPEAERPLEEAYAEALRETRKRYCTPRSEIRAELAELRKGLSPEPRKDPFAELEAKKKKEKETTTEAATQTEQINRTVKLPPKNVPAMEETPIEPSAEERSTGSPESKKGIEQAKAESIKNQIIQASGSWRFSYETEKPVNQGTGRVDVVLTLGDLVIACEISATTRAEHEFERGIKKCLQAGFERIFLVCNAPRRREEIQKMVETECTSDEQRRIACVSIDEFLGRLSGLATAHQAKQASSNVSPDSTQPTTGLDVSEAERERATKKIWEDLQRRMKKDRGERERLLSALPSQASVLRLKPCRPPINVCHVGSVSWSKTDGSACHLGERWSMFGFGMTVTIPQERLGDLVLSEKDALVDIAIGLYKREQVSLGRAGEIAGLSSPGFLAELGRRRIPINYDTDDLRADMAVLESLS